ncbi:MAG: META domain-containing protein [Pseudomonadota bacterium]
MAALVFSAAACGSDSQDTSSPAYLPEAVREAQERQAIQLERLERSLPGVDWDIVSVGGTPVIDLGTAVIRLDPDGSVSGSTGCNQFNASWSIEGNQIDIGPAVTTRMACSPPVTLQEQTILAILDAAVLIGVGDEGALFISTLEGDFLTGVPSGD